VNISGAPGDAADDQRASRRAAGVSALRHGPVKPAHPADERRFSIVLNSVDRDPGFNPDEMGAYMRKQLRIDRDDDGNAFNISIKEYVAASWAIRDYLSANDF
jgi:hypothetical protein